MANGRWTSPKWKPTREQFGEGGWAAVRGWLHLQGWQSDPINPGVLLRTRRLSVAVWMLMALVEQLWLTKWWSKPEEVACCILQALFLSTRGTLRALTRVLTCHHPSHERIYRCAFLSGLGSSCVQAHTMARPGDTGSLTHALRRYHMLCAMAANPLHQRALAFICPRAPLLTRNPLMTDHISEPLFIFFHSGMLCNPSEMSTSI